MWPGDKLTGVTGRDQVAAAMGIYGPRTTYVLALKDIPGTHEFLLLDEGLLLLTILSNPNLAILWYLVFANSRCENLLFPFENMFFIFCVTKIYLLCCMDFSLSFYVNNFPVCVQENGYMSRIQQKLVKERCFLLEI